MTETVEEFLARGGKIEKVEKGIGKDTDLKMAINARGRLRYTGKEREHQEFQIRGGRK